MIKKIIKKLLERRHFWRDASFDELSELYVSMTVRSVAISSVGIFVPIYMFRLGYTLQDLFMLYGWYATTMAVVSIGSAWLVARIGPKHSMLMSFVFQLTSMGLFLTLGQINWPLYVIGFVWGVATNLFFLSYHVDFSKVKHAHHSGKELGYMYIMQKIGYIVGPLLGGVIGTVFGGSYVFLVAAVLMLFGVMVLLRTAEPVKTRQRLDFSLPVHKMKIDMQSYAAFATENILTNILWPTFVVLFVLVGGVYIKLGLLSSISVLVSILATYIFGKIADAKKGRRLLRISASLNSLLHLSRSFATSLPHVFAINILNDSLTIGYSLPYTKGWYSAADDFAGKRIAYFAAIEVAGNTARAVACWMLAVLSMFLSARLTLTIGFVAAAIVSLLIVREKFKALSPRRL